MHTDGDLQLMDKVLATVKRPDMWMPGSPNEKKIFN
jgi:hypothetical protein